MDTKILLATAIASALYVAQCTPPTQHNPAVYGTVKVGFGPSLDGLLDWREDHLVQLRIAVSSMNALGPRFDIVSEGEADVVLRPFDSGSSCANGSERYTPGTRFVEIDYKYPCIQGDTSLRAAAMHGIGHFLGMGHVCEHENDAEMCTTLAPGRSVMSPGLVPGGSDPASFDEAWDESIAVDHFTDSDLAEYRRSRGM